MLGLAPPKSRLNPALLIIPDRAEDQRADVVAGFSQATRAVLEPGMAAEIACDSNLNIAMDGTVLPARVVAIQDAIAVGQFGPSGRLFDPSEWARRGDLVVYLDLVHPEHETTLLDGSGCIVQAYSTHIHGTLEGSLIAHGIEALGVLKAILLRIKVWIALAAGIGLAGGH